MNATAIPAPVVAEIALSDDRKELEILLLALADEVENEVAADWLRQRAGSLCPRPEKWGNPWVYMWGVWYPETAWGENTPAHIPEWVFRKMATLRGDTYPEDAEHLQYGIEEVWSRLFDALNAKE